MPRSPCMTSQACPWTIRRSSWFSPAAGAERHRAPQGGASADREAAAEAKLAALLAATAPVLAAAAFWDPPRSHPRSPSAALPPVPDTCTFRVTSGPRTAKSARRCPYQAQLRGSNPPGAAASDCLISSSNPVSSTGTPKFALVHGRSRPSYGKGAEYVAPPMGLVVSSARSRVTDGSPGCCALTEPTTAGERRQVCVRKQWAR